MAKTIVIYDSLTGNTKKVAEVIAKTLNCSAVPVDKFSGKADIMIIGTPVHGMRPSVKIKEFLSQVSAPKFAFFCTYGVPGLGKKMADSCLKFMRSKVHGDVIGVFRCAGFHQFLKTSKGHPDEDDLEAARGFAEDLIEAVK
jgi:flavodoxin